MSERTTLSVDPGVSMGWAIWNRSTWNRVDWPKAAGVVHASRGWSWQENADYVQQILSKVIKDFGVIECHYELPSFFQDVDGQIAAKNGDLGKLYRSVGRLEELCFRHQIKRCEHPVPEWKGQLKKPVVTRRICRVLGAAFQLSPEDAARKLESLGCRTHAWDAVGIGLYAKGCMEKPPKREWPKPGPLGPLAGLVLAKMKTRPRPRIHNCGSYHCAGDCGE